MGLISKQAGFDLRTKVQRWLDEFKKERGWTEHMPKYLMTVEDNNTIWINDWHDYVLKELFHYRNIPSYICFEFRELGMPLPDGWVSDMGDCFNYQKEEEILKFLNSTEFRYLHHIRVLMVGIRIRADFLEKVNGVWQIAEQQHYGTNK